MEAIHIGREIKKVMKQQGMNATELGKIIGKHYTLVYGMLRKPHLHCSQLAEISQALGQDFFSHYCQCPQQGQVHQQTETLEKQIQELRKENAYLKEINELLKGKK